MKQYWILIQTRSAKDEVHISHPPLASLSKAPLSPRLIRPPPDAPLVSVYHGDNCSYGCEVPSVLSDEPMLLVLRLYVYMLWVQNSVRR